MNYTGELLFGKYPVQRTNPKPGQSKWYYIDPRYNGLGEIDVESENSPNPYENEIKEYLYRNEPEHYKEMYGNEEPVHQNRSTVNQLTGMQTLADNNTFQPISMSVNASMQPLFPTLPPIQGVQLAQNDVNSLNDGNLTNFDNKILTDQKYYDILTFLRNKNVEGFHNYPYLDSVGKKTVCTGNLITSDDPKIYPFYNVNTDNLATKEEIINGYNSLDKYSQQQLSSESEDDFKAEYFQAKTPLRLRQQQCDVIDRNIIETKWKELVDVFPNFSNMSSELQRAIFDVHYQSNIFKTVDEENIDKSHPYGHMKWKNLWLSAKNKDIQGIANNLHVQDGNKYRNHAKKKMALSGKFCK